MSMMFTQDDELYFDYLRVLCDHRNNGRAFLARFDCGPIYPDRRSLCWIHFLGYRSERTRAENSPHSSSDPDR